MQREEAMLSKKYVGPAECASCDKGIVNLNGLRAEQVHWNKLPFREPAERLAKVSCFKNLSEFLVWARFQ
jgi:hypothetical protein